MNKFTDIPIHDVGNKNFELQVEAARSIEINGKVGLGAIGFYLYEYSDGKSVGAIGTVNGKKYGLEWSDISLDEAWEQVAARVSKNIRITSGCAETDA